MSKTTCFILFPTQLYDKLENIPKDCDVYLVEDPVFYYDAQYKPFKVNKIKIAFLHACIKSYIKAHKKVKYISWGEIQRRKYTFVKSYNHLVMYDPIDHDLVDKYTTMCKAYGLTISVLNSPDFLIDKESIKKEYYDVKKHSIRHASFYNYMKGKLGILNGVSNLDKMNRSPPPKEPPQLYKYSPSKSALVLYNEAIAFADQNFPTHYGSPAHVVIYPISHKDAEKAFDVFLHERFKLFGVYEDAIMQEDPFMYHSVISPLLNVGLLTPKYILSTTLEFYKRNKSMIPLSSLEGFLRQIVGWRSFMQSLYLFKCDDLLSSNLPNNNKTFKDASIWYKGETGIYPLDQEIKKALSFGYAHHIVRLMMFMNLFILCELHPYEIYKWFMEVVSMDAYSWVMVSNIYAMGYFHPKIMTKPYLSTSNYITKMSNYKKDGVWDVTWDGLYHAFVQSKPKQYTFFYLRSSKNSSQHTNKAKEFKDNNFKPLFQKIAKFATLYNDVIKVSS
jgi:deoxyribodipyrimidine photolyase-related protein